MIKKFLAIIFVTVTVSSLVSCNVLDTYHNAVDAFEDENDKAQEKDVTGKFLRKSLEKNENVNDLIGAENETSTVTNNMNNKTNFLGR